MRSVRMKAFERPTLAPDAQAQPLQPLQQHPPLLSLRGVNAGYGASRVLHDLDLSVHQGETLVVMGRNGVGKTTLVETIMGLTDHHSGVIEFRGLPMHKLAPHLRNRAGIAWVPQQREVFPSLTVHENLAVVQRAGPWDTERVYGLFPRLKERQKNYGDQLSGGEQQMLALGRALMTNPTLLLLDEPVEGLAHHRRGDAARHRPHARRRQHDHRAGRAEVRTGAQALRALRGDRPRRGGPYGPER
jgi:branched-chain amino acid transport system ATP-binding protein